jgi:NADP-dependent aldehyde dehydrogenase
MTTVQSVNPRTGEHIPVAAHESTQSEVDEICKRAAHAAPELETLGRNARALLLDAMAAALEADRAPIVATAASETALSFPRLEGELNRACYQLRKFADVLREGSYLQASIDHAGDTAMGPRPDLRRMLVPIGPVGVFAASNFPLAFSLPGGDTAAAVAAGCPVVVKAHPGHPATSLLCFKALTEAILSAGAPPGVLGLLFGEDAGKALVKHSAIRAIAFTGSQRGGKALLQLANSRADPIPFYGELGSLNPLVVTPSAAQERGDAIAAGLGNSITLGSGQFCTKPGILFISDDAPGRQLISRLTELLDDNLSRPLLTYGIAEGYRATAQQMSHATGAEKLTSSDCGNSGSMEVRATLMQVSARDLSDAHLTECFGPFALIVTYNSEQELLTSLDRLPGSLTGTIHRGEGEKRIPDKLAALMLNRVGRLIFDGYPTGVAVEWSMQHGGPWPATTNPIHTSVGMTSINRFLRPVAWQDAPSSLLPAELRDGPPIVPRRVDGQL